MLEAVRDGKNESVFSAGKVVEKSDNLVLRTRVETAGDLVAEKDFGLARHFHRQSESPTLAAGEDLHTLVGKFLHAHLGE